MFLSIQCIIVCYLVCQRCFLQCLCFYSFLLHESLQLFLKWILSRRNWISTIIINCWCSTNGWTWQFISCCYCQWGAWGCLALQIFEVFVPILLIVNVSLNQFFLTFLLCVRQTWMTQLILAISSWEVIFL